MNILIAPDKFKGTISATEAASIIASSIGNHACITAPMADGGEGTAHALCNDKPGWEKRPDYYVCHSRKIAVIDSSAIIGTPSRDLLAASSEALGVKVREIIKGGCDTVYIGVGGTMTCDAGIGFLMGLGIEKLEEYRTKLVGLCDVEVPLLPSDSADCDLSVAEMQTLPSALMFAKQKGALDIDYPVLWRRLRKAQTEYGKYGPSPFDGAGGGLGFALASAIGAECVSGAQFVLDKHDINWEEIDAIITGEGCFDAQTSHCKVVGTVATKAAQLGIPCYAICGKVESNTPPRGCTLIDCSKFLPDSTLTPELAKERLKMACEVALRPKFG